MSDEILEAMAELPSVCEHLNLPVQAGNDLVLKRMRRTYTADLWRDRIAKARELMPDVTVATDIIVGFPGETDEQFADTLNLLEETGLDKVHVAMYSPRPGTIVSSLGGRYSSRRETPATYCGRNSSRACLHRAQRHSGEHRGGDPDRFTEKGQLEWSNPGESTRSCER